MKRSLTLTAIISIIFFNVSGGPYGLESVLKDGPGLAMLLIVMLFEFRPVAFTSKRHPGSQKSFSDSPPPCF